MNFVYQVSCIFISHVNYIIHQKINFKMSDNQNINVLTKFVAQYKSEKKFLQL